MTTLSPTSSLDCAPRWATPRDESRQTLGPRVAAIADALRQPLMPWQRQVADVALEVDERGMPVYRQVVLTVPRQSGKTTLLLSLLIHRCLAWPSGKPQRVTYAAQNGVSARQKFMDEHVPILEASPVFAPLFKTRRTSGHEAVEWENGSRWSITAATERAGHGQTLDLPVIDEAFAYTDARLEQAFVPAMQTRKDAQLWIVSTAGNAASTYLRDKVEAGRAAVDSGKRTRSAYFEWSAPDDADADDPAVWASCMPALGHTVDLPTVQAARDTMSDDEFRRAFLNQWRDGIAADGAFPAASWLACIDMKSVPDDPVVFALDVSPNGASACIAAAGSRPDGLGHMEIADHRPGVSWVAERLISLVGRWSPDSVVVDPTGPAGSLVPELERAGIPLRLLSAGDSVKAAGAIYSDVVEGRVRHRDDPALNAAVAGAVRRSAGDAFRWNRKDSSVDISPLVAVTLARFAQGTTAPAYSVTDSIF